ncbi:MAG: response regulator, partial [Betaproteobacteria bacterium]
MDSTVKNTALSGRRALVTDDSEAAREILKRILERTGMQVTTAGGGAEAVERLGATPGGFDVILMDLVMEKIDGIETMSRMRPILAGHPCKLIAMSASISPEVAARCLEVGAEADILAKPFRTANVLAAVNRALGAPLPTPKPGTDPDLVEQDFVRMPVPSFPGCDLAGAIERCGGDTTMLHHLLADIAIAGFGQVNAARDALRRSDLSTTLKRMHNLRGDLGNLGMTDIAASLL